MTEISDDETKQQYMDDAIKAANALRVELGRKVPGPLTVAPHVALLGGVVSVHMAHTQAEHLADIVRKYKPLRRINRKLVRDNIPHVLTDEWKIKNPRFYPVEELSEAAQKALWLDKLREELAELTEAVRAGNTDKALEEALDLSMFLSEFVITLAPDWNARYNRIAGEKYKRNGGVSKHLVMDCEEEHFNEKMEGIWRRS